jgi:hypothetical protein
MVSVGVEGNNDLVNISMIVRDEDVLRVEHPEQLVESESLFSFLLFISWHFFETCFA